MRKTIVLVSLLGIMLGLTALRQGGDPLVLASIGFVVLASFLAADLGSALTLPRVTGYILAGALLGPDVANILSDTVVTEIKMFNTLALGLIAVSAGLELDLSQLRKVLKTLLLTTAIKILLGGFAVGAVLFAVESYFGILVGGEPKQTLALSLVLGVLSIGTSPSIALAVMSETKAKGRMAELVLGAAVLKDLVVVICLAIAVAMSGSWLGAESEHNIVVALGIELGASVVFGAVLGVLSILYMRFVHAEMLLFISAMILIVAEISSALHLELLLVFISCGFVVRNFSQFAHDLHHPVEMVALPVFVVFFTTAGAAIDLPTAFRLLPIAAALVVTRAACYWFASKYGGRWAGESEAVQRRAWLGYLPQAGVSLGLVGLASGQLAPIASPILSLGTAVVALNLLIGPVTLRRVLLATDVEPTPSHPPPRPSERPTTQLPPTLRKELEAARQEVLGLARTVTDTMSEALEEATETRLEAALARGEFTEEVIDEIFEPSAWPTVSALADQLNGFLDQACARLRQLPETVIEPLADADFRVHPGEPRRHRLRKRWRRLMGWFNARYRVRRVPLRLIVRAELEARLAVVCQDAVARYSAVLLHLKQSLRTAAIGEQTAEQTTDLVWKRVEQWLELWESSLLETFEDGYRKLHPALLDFDGPGRLVPLPNTRLAQASWSRALAELHKEPAEWGRILAAELNLLRVEVTLWRTRQRVRTHLQQLTEELAPIWESHWRTLDAWRTWLAKLKQGERSATEQRKALASELEEFSRQGEALGIGQVVIRTTRELHELALEFRDISEQLPGTLVVYRPRDATSKRLSPEEWIRQTVFPRQEFLESLVEELIPEIEIQVEEIAQRSEQLDQRVSEAQHQLLETLGDPDRANAFAARLADVQLAQAEALIEELDVLQLRWEESLVDLVQAGFKRLSDSLTRSVPELRAGRQRSALMRTVLDGLSLLSRQLRQAFRLVLHPVLRLARQANRALELPSVLRAGAPRQAKECADEIRRWTTPFALLPPSYAKMFSQEPLHEPKLLVGRQETIQKILVVERAEAEGASALIEGEPGSGRTSLLNILQLQLSAQRVLRLEHPRSERVSWKVVLADTLGCAARTSTIRRELERERTTVLIDDLEEWISPRPLRLQTELDEFTSLVVATRRSVAWIVTVGEGALRLFRDVSNIDQAFYTTLSLTPLDATDLAQAVEVRHRRTGLRLAYEPTFVTRWIGRLKGADARSVFFRYLSRATEGNISRALLTWCNQIRIDEQGARESVDLTWSLGLSFIPRFGTLELAILIQLSRYRRITFDELLDSLYCSRVALTRALAFLEMTQLVESQRWKTTWYTLSPMLRPLVYHALLRGLLRQ